MDQIRLVLRTSKFILLKKQGDLVTVSGRFEFVLTPKHGFGLNLIEGFFSKLTRQSLKGIRVKTKEELV